MPPVYTETILRYNVFKSKVFISPLDSSEDRKGAWACVSVTLLRPRCISKAKGFAANPYPYNTASNVAFPDVQQGYSNNVNPFTHKAVLCHEICSLTVQAVVCMRIISPRDRIPQFGPRRPALFGLYIYTLYDFLVTWPSA